MLESQYLSIAERYVLQDKRDMLRHEKTSSNTSQNTWFSKALWHIFQEHPLRIEEALGSPQY